jgi:2-isopropylmalate synthase
VRVGIHCHNDTGCAVANTLAAVDAGATHVQGTVNGYGERTGNADLLAVVANLEVKLDGRSCPTGRLGDATRIAHAVAEVTNVPPASEAAVRRHLGVRAQGRAARQRDQGRPRPLPAHGPGRRRQRHAAARQRHGRPGVDRAQGARAGYDLSGDRELVARVTGRVKEMEAHGFTFEAADASFELLLAEEVEGARPSYFDVESWRVITETRPGDEAVSEATVKLRAEGVRYVVTGEGNGPVNALDFALREAIGQAFPEVAKFELIDYKVRILDQGHGTDAITRVLIETSDGQSSWVTVGVGHNVIEASWGALVDGLTFGLRKHHHA